jgi:DNA mismatch repair protein MutS2
MEGVTDLLPNVPSPLLESSATALEWPRLREYIARKAVSPLGREWTLALEPSTDLAWITAQQQRTAEMRAFLAGGGSFDFHGLFDPNPLLDKARITGSALEALEILALLNVVERVAAWRNLVAGREGERTLRVGPGIHALSASLIHHDLAPLLRTLRGKIEPDGSLADDASPELRRIRRAMESQHRAIEASLRRAARALREDGSTQDDLITVRGERFVIPIKAEFKRKVPGVIHGSSSSGQTVFVEPMETIEQNNELVRLLDEEQSEIHRILVAMTAALAADSPALTLGTAILAEVESHFVRARFALELDCAIPTLGDRLALKNARHPLLELRMKRDAVINLGAATPESRPSKPVPLSLALEAEARQLIISGPNTGGKTVALKTTGLLALMAQAGLPVPAEEATFPLFTEIFADIGDAQSIERNLSSFSAHVVNVDHISRHAGASSLVLLDELGSATDPEEGAALAVAVAEHFLELRAWTCITTHLTSLKVYAAQHAGVLNAAVGFNQHTLAPTYELRLGVPGASAGLNIAERLGMQPGIVAAARAQLSTQQADIGAFLDQLHDQLASATAERVSLKRRLEEVAAERARLETEGKAEQKQRTRELEGKLSQLLEDFESQLRDSVKAIEDKTVAQKIARDSALRMSRLKREFSEQFSSTVLAHNTGADRNDPSLRKPDPKAPKAIKVGDLVTLKSLGRQARVDRLVDDKTWEVSIGQMKMRVTRAEIADIETIKVATPLEAARRRGGVTVQTRDNLDGTPMEINVIGRRAEEAEDEVARYIDRAFLAGLPRVRIVHGTGMGVLRRTLREFLKSHPHVATFAEATQQEGGQGATLVELRQ